MQYEKTGSIMDGLNTSIVKRLYVTLPPVKEQYRITDFLDAKCARIDSIKKNVEAEIEALKQYKKSVITEAVTKGLDKNVKMKDSGIPWIGKIPKEWKISKIKYVAELYNGDRGKNYPSGNDLLDEGIVFLTSNNIHSIELDCSHEISKYISEKRYRLLGGAKIKIGDIIYCLRGSIGNCSINLNQTIGTIASSLIDIRPRKIVPKFLNYSLQSDINNTQTKNYSTGSCAANLSAENVSNYSLIQPPIEEQHQIANYLDAKCAKIDSIIHKKQELLANLDTYKKSLIYEYVTGKKEVPAV